MKQSTYYISALLLLGWLCATPLWAQKVKEPTMSLSGQVVDETGKGIADALVTADEGKFVTYTDEAGNFTVSVTVNGAILVEADDFEPLIVATEKVQAGPLTLVSMPYGLRSEDLVNMPFGQLPSRRIAGAVNTLSAEEVLSFDTRQGVTFSLNARIPGVFGSSNIRGLGNPLVIVDGIPRLTGAFNLQEIDQITVLKDASAKALYGAQATEGVILVTTKKGAINKRRISVTVEQGFSNWHRLPNYLDAPTYMELYNEALVNDGAGPLYTEEEIEMTRSGADPVRYPNQDLFSDVFLKPSRPFTSIITDFAGGNQTAQYYLNVAYSNVGTFLNLGEGANERFDQVNLRGNVDYQVTPAIKANLGLVTVFNISQGPLGDYWGATAGQTEPSNANFRHPNSYPLLIDTNLVAGSEVLATARTVDGNLVGGSAIFQENPYADLTMRGSYNGLDRVAQLNTGLDFDLNGITQGLKLKTYLSFDIYNFARTQFQNQYAVYVPSYVPNTQGEDSLIVTRVGEDVLQNDQEIQDITFFQQLGYFGLLTYQRDFGDHSFDVTGLGYVDQRTAEGLIQPLKNIHFGLRANYMLKNKYVVDFTGAYTGSLVFAQGNRWGFSPTLALGWIASQESFLANNKLIDYLKVRVSGGILNTDQGITNYNLSRTTFERPSNNANNFNYGDGISNNSRTLISNFGNPDLTFAKRGEVNAGFEALIAKNLWVEANYYVSWLYDQITQASNTTPAYLSGSLVPYVNFGIEREQGVGAGLRYNVDVGQVGLTFGANMVYSVPQLIETDEPFFEDEQAYRLRAGQVADARFGYVAEGLFADSAEILGHATQTFGPVQPGDIKYRDLNGDGVIDQADQQNIGNSSSRFFYGLNLNVRFKGVELFVQGSGSTGQTIYTNNNYFWVFGDRPYSEEVLGRWTPQTAATATYPRLTATNNTNNFRNSTYWLRENNGFRLHAVQLTYNLPEAVMKKLKMENLAVYVRGSNLVDISPISDIRLLNVGSAPQTRSYAAGIRIIL